MTESVTGNEVARALAGRLRQAVQGCTQHIHGPVQAWAAIRSAINEGTITAEEVLREMEASTVRRLQELQEQGPETDPRFKKERLTLEFVEALLGRPS